MKKIKGYLIGFGFIVLGVVIILFMFEHINKLYKNRIEITYANEINENLEYNVKINYNIKDKENVLCSINNKDFLSIDKCQFNLKAGKYTLYLKRVEKVDVYNRNKEKTGKIIYREKGASLNRDEFIISITAWIVNSTGKILMTQRRLDKDKGGMWEPTTGLIQSGETSTNGALRELKEEIGIELNVEDIKLVQEFVEEITDLNFFRDIYLVNKEIPLEQIKFIDGEVINAKYVTIDEFNEMIKTIEERIQGLK